jgi:hypothetical protein
LFIKCSCLHPLPREPGGGGGGRVPSLYSLPLICDWLSRDQGKKTRTVVRKSRGCYKKRWQGWKYWNESDKNNDNWLGTEKMKIRITITTAEDSRDYRKRAWDRREEKWREFEEEDWKMEERLRRKSRK